MHEILGDLMARVESDGRRQLEILRHVRRVEATLRAVDERLYLLRARYLCLGARLEALSERLATIEGACGDLQAGRPAPPVPAAPSGCDGAPTEGCAQAA